MRNRIIAEASDYEYKVALERNKPRSWLKSVSAFANTSGGTLIFGIDDKSHVVGLEDVQDDAEAISRLIKDRISPVPRFILNADRDEGKDILLLSVPAGQNTPYYYRGDGNREAYVRIGNESVVAPDHMLNQLILDGLNQSYDALVSRYDAKDFSFSKLRERYYAWTGKSFDDSYLESFGLVAENGKLTNAGALIADESPIRQSRVFCVRWNGTTKAGGLIDAIDSAEFTGGLIILLNESAAFIRRNMRLMWRKTANSRIEMPDYAERSYFEALVNAFVHRQYLELGSEVHVDIFDDRLEVTSPGGMPGGTNIQDFDLRKAVISKRRNPVLADVFSRLGYMERQGSGLRKIIEGYETEPNYTEAMKPEFYSNSSQFTVVLKNLNYNRSIEELSGGNEDPFSEKVAIDSEKVAIDSEKVAIDSEKVAIDLGSFVKNELKVNSQTKNKILKMIDVFGPGYVFGRKDIASLTGESVTAAGMIIVKLKNAGVIEPVSGQGKGKYRFRSTVMKSQA